MMSKGEMLAMDSALAGLPTSVGATEIPNLPLPPEVTLLPLAETPLTWAVYCLAMGIVALVFFSNLASLPFDMDDESYLSDSAEMSKDFSAILFPTRFQGRPVVNLILWGGYSLWGEDSARFHLIVVFFHVLAGLLLAKVARSTGVSLEVAFLAGLLFLVNVAHFRAVQWVSAVAYPLSLVLCLVFVLCYLKYLGEQKWIWLAGACLSLPLALLAHQASIGAWLFCLFLSWRRSMLRSSLRLLIPLGVFCGAVILAMVHLYPDSPPIQLSVRSPDFSEIAQQLLWFWSRLFTTAHWLPLSIHKCETWELIPGAIASLGFVALLRFGGSLSAVWVVWVCAMTLPFLNMLPAHAKDLPQGGPSRFIYLASAGTSVLMAWGLQRSLLRLVGRKPGWSCLVFFAAISALLVSSFAAFQRLRSFSYYTAGRNSMALGHTQLGAQQLQLALAQGKGVIPLLDAYSRLCLQAMGTADLAAALQRALEEFPADPNLNLFQLVDRSLGPDPVSRQEALARVASWLGTLDDAKRRSTEFVMSQAYANYGLSRTKQNDFIGAIPAYRLALDYNPGNVKTSWGIITAFLATGQNEDAISAAAQALRQESDDPSMPGFRALVLRLEGKVSEAIHVCRDAIAVCPDETLFAILGECYEYKGDWEGARKVYVEWLASFPQSSVAQQHLSDSNALGGQRPGAVAK